MICQVIRPAGGAGRPPQASARKILDLENVPYSHLGRGVKGGWHQGGARTIHPRTEHASPCLRAIPTHAHR